MRMLTAYVTVIFLLIVGCAGGAPKEEDRTEGEITTVPPNLVVSDLKVTLEVAPYRLLGRMLVTEEFTFTATEDGGKLTVSDQGISNPTPDEMDVVEKSLRKYGANYKGAIEQNDILDLSPFAVYKNRVKLPVSIEGETGEGPSRGFIKGEISSVIELKPGESADVKIVRHGILYSDAPYSKEDYIFGYDLGHDFEGLYVDGASVTANFTEPPMSYYKPPHYEIVDTGEVNVTWNISPHIPENHNLEWQGFYYGDDAEYLVMVYPADDVVWLKILTGLVNFRQSPDSDSPKTTGKETLKNGEIVKLLSKDGDWYKVYTEDDYWGWVRWRYKDPDTEQVNIYVEEFRTPY